MYVLHCKIILFALIYSFCKPWTSATFANYSIVPTLLKCERIIVFYAAFRAYGDKNLRNYFKFIIQQQSVAKFKEEQFSGPYFYN